MLCAGTCGDSSLPNLQSNCCIYSIARKLQK
jgi:hypothetical protein